MPAPSVATLIKRKLGSYCAIGEDDLAAIAALPHVVRTLEANAYLVREGQRPEHCIFLISGLAFRQKLTVEGARQIVSLHIPGDFVDLQHLFLKEADHNVQTLTRAEVALLQIEALQELALTRPAIGKAMWIDALVDASIFREWVVNVGRRDAMARVAHVLCEFSARMDAAGFVSDGPHQLPITQEQLADCVGLTPVHVNRTLRKLAEAGLIDRVRRHPNVTNWDALRRTADFNPRYLHLDQAKAPRP
jgi:CRP-like cAMP-binding protein